MRMFQEVFRCLRPDRYNDIIQKIIETVTAVKNILSKYAPIPKLC